MAFHLEKRWKKLFGSALYRLKTLHSTKIKFSQMTSNDIEKFKQEVRVDIENNELRHGINASHSLMLVEVEFMCVCAMMPCENINISSVATFSSSI